MKSEHAKCVGLLKAADDRAREEQLKTKEATDELRKLQRRFDDLSLEHAASVRSAEGWRKKAEEFESELRIADEQVYTQYELGFQNVVDQAVYHYRCPTDQFDVHLGVVEGKLKKVYERLDEVNVPAQTSAPPTADS